jgi:hypothetical protein
MPTRSIYTYSQLQRELNAKLHGRRADLTSGESGDTNVERDLLNSAVRVALTEIDFRGNIREAALTPNLMDNQYDYALPADVKGDAIIDLRPQNTDSRGEFETYDIVPQAEFDRRKKVETGIATIVNDDLSRALRVSANVQDETLLISSLEDSNWHTYDTGAVSDSDIKIDNSDFLEGSGAIRFQTDSTDSTDSTVGIQNSEIQDLDIASFLGRGSAFVDGKLTVADTGIHQLTLRIGSDCNNFYEISDSTQNDCSPFVSGWNKVRFDFQNKVMTGSVTDTQITYAALFWSRDTTTAALLHAADSDWGFDNLILKRGKYYNLSYYSRYVWQDTALTLTENSSNDSHALMVQNDELEIIMAKAAELASGYLRDYEDQKYYATEYQRLKESYLMKNPSQALILTTSRYNFEDQGQTTESDS